MTREDYAEFIRQYQDRIYRYCLTLLANEAEAEEAAQVAFVKAYESLSKFEGRSSLATWVSRIAHNVCMDNLRIRGRTKPLDDLIEQGREPAAIDETGKDRGADLKMMERALQAIKPQHREILALREVRELRYDEIAATLGCTLDAVKARLKRARQELHAVAQEMMGGELYESR